MAVGASASAQEFWAGALGYFGRYVWNYGEPVFDRDWDVLLVFDACRVDIMDEVARSGEYDVLDSFDADRDVMDSVASRSPEWIAKTFDPDEWGDELAETAYVTANLHSRDIPDPDRVGLVDEVWKYGWDDDFGVVPPRTMTDRAIDVMREHDPDRLIVHYMQPHLPFRSLIDDHPEWFNFKRGLDNPTPSEFKTLWRRLRDGEVDHDTVWDAYVDNLRWAMDEVEILEENLDADSVVITADHANAMGEWWCYGHQSTAPLRAMKRVPWVEFSATDEETYDPEIAVEDTQLSEREYEDRLRHLGYL
ncbi:hypothetical protein AUR65_014560 [Haloferax marisrubri]|uniref:Sulfatase N-terminal domain-containing protein n=1 Tax=Haloferax marisrubri TaxID=1544719 RepID=A0A2P4NPA0_9EURY|nr:hypothetical protein AUR65_014560 [Haloferax marisrubri]